MGKTIHHESFASNLRHCKSLERRIHHTLTRSSSMESYIFDYRGISNNPFDTVTPTYLINSIRLSASALKINHASIIPYLVRVTSLRAGGVMSLKLHRSRDTTIMKMGRLSSPTFLMYIHNQIRNISKGLAQKTSDLSHY